MARSPGGRRLVRFAANSDSALPAGGEAPAERGGREAGEAAAPSNWPPFTTIQNDSVAPKDP
jgi:hypothetical protein